VFHHGASVQNLPTNVAYRHLPPRSAAAQQNSTSQSPDARSEVDCFAVMVMSSKDLTLHRKVQNQSPLSRELMRCDIASIQKARPEDDSGRELDRKERLCDVDIMQSISPILSPILS
jgi:hypothetical protein